MSDGVERADPQLRVSISPLRATLPRPVGGARDRAQVREGLLLRLEDEDGRVGLGEASPLPGFSRESLQQARAALICGDLTGAPSARFAHETACADLAAQRRGVSLAQHLAGAAPGSLTPQRVQALVDQLEDAPAEALRLVERGARALKIKVGRLDREAEERAALRQIARSLAGTGVVLRADANGMLPADSTLPALLAELGFAFLEDPFPLTALRAAPPLPLPIALDQSAAEDPEGALAALDEGRAHALVLKPALIGGLAATRALAKRARQRGGAIAISHLLEGPVGLAACAHLALALGVDAPAEAPPQIHGLAPWLGLDLFESQGARLPSPAFVGVDEIQVPRAPGLGAGC